MSDCDDKADGCATIFALLLLTGLAVFMAAREESLRKHIVAIEAARGEPVEPWSKVLWKAELDKEAK